MKKNTTTIFCPNCGAEVKIGAHEHTVKNATIIGKDSNLGKIPLELTGKNVLDDLSARERALTMLGYDVSKLITTVNKDGKYIVLKDNGDGTFSNVSINESDPVIGRIVSGGEIHNPLLCKRHVLAQFLKMLTRGKYSQQQRGKLSMDGHFDNNLRARGYRYQWDVITDEFERQVKMAKHKDRQRFEDRLFYNSDVLIAMMNDYVAKIKDIAEKHKVKTNHKEAYYALKGFHRIIPGHNTTWNRVTLTGFKWYIDQLTSIIVLTKKAAGRSCADDLALCKEFVKYMVVTTKDNRTMPMCEEFINAYKGYGAYFSMQNLILYHGCHLACDKYNNIGLDKVGLADHIKNKQIELGLLKDMAMAHRSDYYFLVGAFKKMVELNNFDIAAKQREWLSAKTASRK